MAHGLGTSSVSLHGIVWLLVSVADSSELLEEPICSKFHFEEKVLEKLVRIEHKLHLQEEMMSAWEKNIDGKITALKETEEMVKVTVKETEAKEQAIKEKLEYIIEQTQSTTTAFMSNVTEDVRVKMETLMKEQQPQRKIAFKARGVTNASPSNGDRLVFATEVLNVGDAYDESTGIFTAPVGGVYFFTVQICTNPKKWYNVYIMAKNEAVGTASHENQDTTGTCTSGDGVAELEKGDTVWIRCESGSSAVVYEDSTDWNSFSGILIRT